MDSSPALHPVLAMGLEARPGKCPAAVDLAALHGEVHLAAAGIAGDDLQLETEDVAQHVGHHDAFGADAGAGNDQLACPQVLPGLHAGTARGHGDAGVGVDAADPVELDRIVLGVGGIAEQRLERNAALRCADMQAVLGRDIGDVVGHDQAAAARHVAHDHLRLTRQVAAEIFGEQPRVEVVAAAGRETDIDGDVLALVELRRRLG